MMENKKYYIDQINSSKAYRFTSFYHYSGVGFKKASLNLGVYRKEDNLLVGVLQWGCSAQDAIRLDRYVKEPIKKEEYLELNRFCMADSEGRNSESQAISLGVKWIKQNLPHIKLLVSYAGRKEGNYGYIYQATNWEYLGYFISPGFWSVDGQEKHLLTLCYHYNKYGKQEGLNNYLINKYQDVRQTWTKQFIYIQRLDKTLTAASPILSYPKPDNEFPIKIKERILKQNDEIYNNPIIEKKTCESYYYEKEEVLFTRAALIRQGVVKSNKDRRIICYDRFGKNKEIFKNFTAAKEIGYSTAGIHKSVDENKIYKDKLFRIYYIDEEIPEEIDPPYLVLIDGLPFYTYVEAGNYLGVSKQAVHQAHQRKADSVKNKEVYWRDANE